ncbi:10267_t:CDS:2 [Cetraspora pellucida]|uniref:10267_t:CDS:1 n=1 Tax=Cetraspora pellucida TaxID=1433469 RepID=A0ACA9M4R7_9GLOM|nr:10267_t:CDS:2 [Cetraspora pellucida]
MPCYLDTIVKIKLTRQNETKDTGSISVWAIGSYPIGSEDNEIEIVIYVQQNPLECNTGLQAIFKREEFYSIGGKIVPGHYARSVRPKMSVATSTHLTVNSKPLESNKCLLKVFLIGTPQVKPAEIKNTDNCMIEVLITDHAGGQVHDYTVM